MLILGLKDKPLNHIAIVELEGTIGSRIKASEYGKLLRSIEENDRVKAVVLDVDSPGGSATASNYLHLAVQSLAKKKPVIAFIRGVGASGAYLFSCPATRIIAIPSAIIGSIGVISMHPVLYETLNRVGARMDVTKSAPLKDMGSMFREATPEEQAKEQELIDDLYQQFIGSVMEGRRMTEAQARSVATGEVFTGRRSKELGLVDELGDLHRAIAVAAELGSVAPRAVWMKPRKTVREMFSSMLPGAIINELATVIEDRVASRYNFQYRL